MRDTAGPSSAAMWCPAGPLPKRPRRCTPGIPQKACPPGTLTDLKPCFCCLFDGRANCRNLFGTAGPHWVPMHSRTSGAGHRHAFAPRRTDVPRLESLVRPCARPLGGQAGLPSEAEPAWRPTTGLVASARHVSVHAAHWPAHASQNSRAWYGPPYRSGPHSRGGHSGRATASPLP